MVFVSKPVLSQVSIATTAFYSRLRGVSVPSTHSQVLCVGSIEMGLLDVCPSVQPPCVFALEHVFYLRPKVTVDMCVRCGDFRLLFGCLCSSPLFLRLLLFSLVIIFCLFLE